MRAETENWDSKAFMDQFSGKGVWSFYMRTQIGPTTTFIDAAPEELESGVAAHAAADNDVLKRHSQSDDMYGVQYDTAIFALFPAPPRTSPSLLACLETEGLEATVAGVLGREAEAVGEVAVGESS